MYQRFCSLLLLTGLFLLSACTSAGITVANAPVPFFEGTIERDIVFDEESKQTLDIYIPDHATEERLPVVIFFYGGRWTNGEKGDFAFVGTTLAEEGFIVVIPDYRKYPDVRFPAFVEDGANAVSWVHKNIGDYRGKPETLFLAGHSSGAHIASLLIVDERYLESDTNSAIKGFAGLAGPYSFTPKAEDVKIIFGPPSQYPQMQATTFVDGSEPPMLLLYGRDDELVAPYNLERLRRKIEEKGGQVQAKYYSDIGHIEIIGAMSWIWEYKAPVIDDLTLFFRENSDD